MAFKLEKPDGATWHTGICEFLAERLSEDHEVRANWLVVFSSAGLISVFVNRDDKSKGILGVDVYYSIPNPLRGDKRMVANIAKVGLLPSNAQEYVSAVFDAFREGWEWR